MHKCTNWNAQVHKLGCTLCLYPSVSAAFSYFRIPWKRSMNWWSCISKGFWSLRSTQKEGRQQEWQKRYTYHCWISEEWSFFILCNLKKIIIFDDVFLYHASFCNDPPLYLQWYVPLVKPSSLQKTSWLDLFLFRKKSCFASWKNDSEWRVCMHDSDAA